MLEIQHITLSTGKPVYNDLRSTAARIKEYPLIKTWLSVIKLVLIALTSQQSLKMAKNTDFMFGQINKFGAGTGLPR